MSSVRITHKDIGGNLFPGKIANAIVKEEKRYVSLDMSDKETRWFLSLKKKSGGQSLCNKCIDFIDCAIHFLGDSHCEPIIHKCFSLENKKCPRDAKGLLNHNIAEGDVVISFLLWNNFDITLSFLYTKARCRRNIRKRVFYFSKVDERNICSQISPIRIDGGF